ncbi:hypothetical protein [Pseudoroseicyclus aestuarii]|uniref:Uncharacterized protein n=1 Tax=Pseudoroseicyclus aestuarii TaxID=1795041 RepID=A0A318SNT8_9RHOB|nr:hypothetical protein [Pseudoroseicyclus aestuarii]PYE82275.1 hypothetical protein DFP88_10427 [Pseudoroseicyclus aestuarii]
MLNRLGPVVIIVASALAVGCGLYAYFAPLTGVTGTWGPLAASFGALCLLIAGALLLRRGHRGLRVLLLVLMALGLVLTAFATFLLHQWVMLVALGLCALGWLIALTGPKGATA